ncbi:MAG: TetR/AcrR family transcriptional regulator [Chloroflexales bacterium]|nr:TetR/AcrR family transcriptional regulator [Chloroflexales bacterium]
MSDPAEVKRRERKDMRRNQERVLQAAHELFAERGAEVTMEEVARRAGVGVGTIYRRFPSKEHLFAAVSQAACTDAQHCLQQATEECHDLPTKLRAIVLVQYRQIKHQAALIDLRPDHSAAAAAHPAGGDPPGLYATLHSILEQGIADAQRQGVIRPGNPRILAALCLELLSSNAFQNLQRALGGETEDLAEHVAQFVLNGLGVESPR